MQKTIASRKIMYYFQCLDMSAASIHHGKWFPMGCGKKCHSNAITVMAVILGFLLVLSPNISFSQSYPSIYDRIYNIQNNISKWYSDKSKKCRVKLFYRKIIESQSVNISWTGACPEGKAHGAGDLSILYDGIVIFKETFNPSRGSIIHRGIPMTTLRTESFLLRQSACNNRGMRVRGKPRGGTFAVYPSYATPNYWTLVQDAV